MIKSMTGFGRAEIRGPSGVLRVEIRTVNHRFFDVSMKAPNGLAAIEDRIQEFVHKYIKRGRVNLFLSHHSGDKNYGRLSLDAKALQRYYTILKNIKKQLAIQEDVTLSHIISFPDVITLPETDMDANALWPEVKKVLEQALVKCDAMRRREGRGLCKDITTRCRRISDYLHKISELASGLVKEYKEKLDARIQDIVKGLDIDRGRLETELALFAKQSDISEELTRVQIHVESVHKILKSDEEAGRKLDFIIQELHREINTMGQKSNNIHVSKLTIEIKSELEKMREQVQNIE